MSAPDHHPKQREYAYVKADNAKREDLNMSAPERLYVWQEEGGAWAGDMQSLSAPGSVEYIRADLYEQAVRERDEARAELA